jgi:hypothetical protein
LLAYETFQAMPKVMKDPGKYSFGDLRTPLKRLSEINHGQDNEDWGTMNSLSLEARIIADGIFPLRQKKLQP